VNVTTEGNRIAGDYVMMPDPNSPAGVRFVAIPGSKADLDTRKAETELSTTEQKAAAGAETTAKTADIVLQDIGRFKEMVQGQSMLNPATGFGATRMSEIGGTKAADAAALAETIGANIGFDRLQAMREASPTGGALGAITERELAALRAVLGSIEQTQSPEQLVRNLERLELEYKKILEKAQAYPGASDFGFSGQPSGGIPAGVTPELWEVMTPEERALWQ
jgi:hypothetical protein